MTDPSPWEGRALERMASVIRSMARDLSRGGATISADAQDIEQRLGLALVRGVRKWTARHGEAVEPDRGWLVTSLAYERQHIRRDVARHGQFFDELDEGLEADLMGDNPSRMLAAIDHHRAVDDVCDMLRERDPDAYDLLYARHGENSLPGPINHGTRSKLYRQKARARDFLKALGITGMEDIDSHATPRSPDHHRPARR